MRETKELTGLPLMRYGYVHVTGLPTHRGLETEPGKIEADSYRLGRHDYNNGVAVAVTMDGEVWIRHSSENRATNCEEFAQLLERLCPNGEGAFVPCSNGEAIPSYMVLMRVSDPYWIGYNGEFRSKVPAEQVTCVRELADPVIALV